MATCKARWAVALAVTMGFAFAPGSASARPDPQSGGGYPPRAHVLSYQYEKQAAPHWCSAASARIALSGRGNAVSQATLARELGLGPASARGPGLRGIDKLANTLNEHVPGGHYQVKQPSSSELPAKLAADVRYDIDHNLAVVINVNRIGDVVFKPGHYAAIVGYRANAGEYLVADPSNTVRQHLWLSARTVVSGIKLNRYVA